MSKMLTKNFSEDEIRCKCGCGLAAIDPQFMNLLQALRDAYGKPLRIVSGVRCLSHNKAEGGAEHSQHVSDPASGKVCNAVDIAVGSGSDRYKLITLATRIFTGIGVAKTFLHVDSRKTEAVCWLY